MKKIYLIILTVFLNMALFSCTPQAIEGNGATAIEEEQCCDEDDLIIPPPPTP